MKPANPRILTMNGGSSSIKFALFEAGDSLRRILDGRIERIGLPEATFRVKGLNQADNFSRLVTAPDHTVAVGALMDWIEERTGHDALTAVGHRVVHGGPKYSKPQLITAEMVEELHRLSPFDPEHLPEEILLTEAFRRRFPDLPQVACYLARTEGLDAKPFNEMVNFQSGLLGVSETSSDMRDLLDREMQDVRAAEAVALFCYQVKKWIGAFAAALGGLNTLVFAGDIGENAPVVRARTCDGLSFLGIELDERRNAANDGVISAAASRVALRVIRTDEELMIAKMVCRVLGLG
jgi:acetate kinase